MRGRTVGALFLAACSTGFGAFAAEPIDTDGPDFVESSEVVPRGRFQYEIDVQEVHGRSAPSSAISTPTLLRYGFADNFELRIAPEGYVRQEGRSGLGDTAFGLKWHAQDRDAASGKPAISWILHFDTPSGAEPFKGRGVRPSLRSVITWELTRDLALGVMPGIKYDTRDDGSRFTAGILGVVLNGRFSDRFRGFVEMSVPQIARAGDGGMLASWDVGVAYLVTEDLQIGARTGIGANHRSPPSYLLLEVAQRF